MDELEGFESWLRHSKSPLTARVYASAVRRFLGYAGKSPGECTAIDVARWLDARAREGVSPRTLNNNAYALKLFFEVIGKPDVARLVPLPRYVSEETRYLEPEQVARVIMSASSLRDYAMFALAYDLALRRGEVPLLRAEGYDPRARTMAVRRLKRKGAAPASHTLPVSDWAAEALEEWLDERGWERGPLFPGRGGAISERTVNHAYRVAARRAGLDPDEHTFHSFARHSRLTHLAIEMKLEGGKIDLTALAKFAGHASPSSTLLYVHLATAWLAGRGPERPPEPPSRTIARLLGRRAT